MINAAFLLVIGIGIVIIACICIGSTVHYYNVAKAARSMSQHEFKRAERFEEERRAYHNLLVLIVDAVLDLVSDLSDTFTTQQKLINLHEVLTQMKDSKNIHILRQLKDMKQDPDLIDLTNLVRSTLLKYYSYDNGTAELCDEVVQITKMIVEDFTKAESNEDLSYIIMKGNLERANITIHKRTPQPKKEAPEGAGSDYFMQQMTEINQEIDTLIDHGIIVVPKEEAPQPATE